MIQKFRNDFLQNFLACDRIKLEAKIKEPCVVRAVAYYSLSQQIFLLGTRASSLECSVTGKLERVPTC